MTTVSLGARHGKTLFATLIVGAIGVLIAPALYTYVTGEAPYEALARTFPGSGVGIGTASLEAASRIAAALTMGGLVWHLLAQPQMRGEPKPTQGPALTILRGAAGTWAGVSLPLAIFKALDTAGVGPQELETAGVWEYFFSSIYAPGSLVIHTLAASAVFLMVTLMRSSTWIVGALWAGAWAIIAPV
ncbi:MAG TPA: hypothetical protein VK054_10970, partial [Beutenbergiaceae bacterium]|nr:hypothetical protein [Beutenbergiaceae bacterium]